MVAYNTVYQAPKMGEADSEKPDVKSEGFSTSFDTSVDAANAPRLTNLFALAAPAQASQPTPDQQPSSAQRKLNDVLNNPSSTVTSGAIGSKGASSPSEVVGRGLSYTKEMNKTISSVKDLQKPDAAKGQSTGSGFMARQAFGLAAVGVAGAVGGAPAAQVAAVVTAIPDATAAISFVGRGFGQDKGASYFAATDKKGNAVGYGASSTVSALASAQPAMSPQADRFVANLTRLPGEKPDNGQISTTSGFLNGFEIAPKVKLEDTPTFKALASMKTNVEDAAASMGMNRKYLDMQEPDLKKPDLKMALAMTVPMMPTAPKTWA